MSEATVQSAIPPHVPSDCVVDLDLYHMPGVEEDFHLSWKRVQDAAPRGVIWTPRNGGHWIAVRGRDLTEIYADYENYSSNIVIVPREWGEQFRLRPTTLDPPAHRPMRRLINSGFSPKIIRALEPKIREIAIGAIEKFRLNGRCDFATEFAELLPITVFMHLANLPVADAAGLRPWAVQLIRPDGSVTATQIMEKFADYLRPYVQARRLNPGDDLISQVVSGEIDGRPMDEQEAIEISTVVLTGGLDTVASFLGFMMTFMARNPAHRRRLIDDPASMRPAVAEIVRRFPIVTKARLLNHDRVIDGVTLKAGEVVVLPPLQGLDDREFKDPMTVDFDRPQRENLTFGNGVHRCPGSILAQSEMEITLQEWLARIPEFELDPNRPPQMKGGFLGAITQLGLRWDPRKTVAVGAA